MRFCTQCGQPVPEGSRFCPSCAAPVTPSMTAQNMRISQEPTRESPSPGTLPPSSTSPHGRFEPGTRLGTRYRIVGLLGRGGMGEVYRADDLELGQSVALKFLSTRAEDRAPDLARFRGEVRIARLIAHPNVCRVYDIGEADGHVFLSMEYIDGEDLASVLRRLGRPTSDKALEIARQVCHGLAAAHEAGMLHRDLKPANVMIDGRGRARITDFGLAGLADELAHRGDGAGTPSYMAPEQLAGGKLSVRSDLYSLGLVLYELFTGKRAFEAGTVAELKKLHESGVTTPADLIRDMDPAVERVILQCLERDPDSRPSSAYAVLGALPGGDPLAAALAAGETPSPELVANAGGGGGMSPAWVAVWVVLAVVGAVTWAGIIGPEFGPLTQPTQVLSVRAADVLSRTGSFGALPRHSAEGFEHNRLHLAWLRTHREGGATRPGTICFWRRWSPRHLDALSIHREIVSLGDPPGIATGEAAVLLDPQGRLIGLRAIPADTISGVRDGTPAWSTLWTAAGLDPLTFTPSALPRPVPATVDSAAAWSGPLPWSGGERVTVQMGSSRGRIVHFTIVHDWGATTAAVDSVAANAGVPGGWSDLLIALVPLVGSIVFGVRNLRLGRGDRKGASRIALFVVVMLLLVGALATRLSEVGVLGAVWDLVWERAFAHALVHGAAMWFAYVAVEPYVRRLWPRMLVSWTRLVSGRARDPLVGHDILVGAAAGSFFAGMSAVAAALLTRSGVTKIPSLIAPEMLQSLTSLSLTGCQLAYSGSICVNGVLGVLVALLLVRLALRRTRAAVAVCMAVFGIVAAGAAWPETGWIGATINGCISALTILMLVRFGVLTMAVASLVTLVMTYLVPSLDLSSWYADRALVPIVVVFAIVLYGAATSLAGKSILGDPLRDQPAR